MRQFLARLSALLPIVALMFSTPRISAQEAVPLEFKYDLIYRMSGWDYNGLVLLDHETLETTPFFEPEQGLVRAVSWSPRGNYLATTLFVWEEGEDHLCILTRAGVLHHCFEDLPLSFDGGSLEQQHVSWTENEQFVYFVQATDTTVQLVEAEVQAGNINRVIFEYQKRDVGDPPLLEWTPDLRYVMVYVHSFTRVVDENDPPVVLVDLATNNHLDLGILIENLRHDPSFPVMVCGFSPQGTYFTAWVDGRLLFLDMTGNVIYRIDDEVSGCPIWQPDEKGLYYVGWKREEVEIYRRIIQYSLQARQRREIYYIGGVNSTIGEILLSPDGGHIAFYATQNIHIIDLEGNEYQLPDEEGHSVHSNPLWVPSLDQ